jgi:hypothetical protein
MQPPPGFSIVPGTDGRDYLVPTFLVPATEVAIAAAGNRSDLRADTAAGGVRLNHWNLLTDFDDFIPASAEPQRKFH